MEKRLPHISIPVNPDPKPYSRPGKFSSKIIYINRDRAEHAKNLTQQLDELVQNQDLLNQERLKSGITQKLGIQIEFRSEPGMEFNIEQLHQEKLGIELLSKKIELNSEGKEVLIANIFVPDGKIAFFYEVLNKYENENSKKKDGTPGNPKYQTIIANLASVRISVLESLWTDDEKFPELNETIWWEIWFRKNSDINTFIQFVQRFNIKVGVSFLNFPDRQVRLIYANPNELKEVIKLLDDVAELRKAKDSPYFFLNSTPIEQKEWLDNLKKRTLNLSSNSNIVVSILDTGVNYAHPLLEDFIKEEDSVTINDDWGIADHYFHGTAMAGLALYQDLFPLLVSQETVLIRHGLESGKILPPKTFPENDEKLYGFITIGACKLLEEKNKDRTRIYCLATTSLKGTEYGYPSSWSGAIDSLAFGEETGIKKRLLIISAGNVPIEQQRYYFEVNQKSMIENPAQSWNSITVGAYTDKVELDAEEWKTGVPLAKKGDLSPASRTSMEWVKEWPYKPDIVMEGGNKVRLPNDGFSSAASLSVLSTYLKPQESFFIEMADTSAATAQAAQLAADLQVQYPKAWSETIRGLLIHSANWTQAMQDRFAENSKEDIIKKLRVYGYGTPDREMAFYSASNSLTMIIENEFQPFSKTKANVKYYELPWPEEELKEKLAYEDVELRVTISYFIEPSPDRRGEGRKFGYASHGIRFAVNEPYMLFNDFVKVVNSLEREDGYKSSSSRKSGWVFGSQIQTKGSIHHDRWIGKGADLAAMKYIAVYPVGGWWKYRTHLKKVETNTRFSLIVSINTAKENIDLYSPVQLLVGSAP